MKAVKLTILAGAAWIAWYAILGVVEFLARSW
jgi:hypothetical protein